MKSLLLLLFVTLSFAQSPDRIPLADEWGYRPAEGSAVAVNPPAFSWVLERDGVSYTVEWAADPGFRKPVTVKNLPWTVYTHHAAIVPGKYYWRYRITGKEGRESTWSKTRTFTVPKEATVFPQPTMEQLRARIPRQHPRLFVTAEDLPRLRQADSRKLIARADGIMRDGATPEPTVRGSSKDPATADHWWSNRVQTVKALQEAEVLAFAYLLTGEKKYGEAARQFTLQLAGWDPDGPTNFDLNCEAAKPMLHRLARAYDWAWPMFTEAERASIRKMLLRRAEDAWKSGEVKRGAGHLNQPYSSHGNRTWHKLAENAIATFGETPESERFLHYAVTKFFAAYPVWSDDDGGWHEGLSYYSGYMSKATWWMDIARNALGIDGFQKPFFAHFGDYPLYAAPPGSPDLGFGDLAHRFSPNGWSFMHYYVGQTRNPYWMWWLNASKVPRDTGDPVLDFLWGTRAQVAAKPPDDLPPSKVFWGTGVAVMNTTLVSAAENVQVKFKSSPMGRWSHGHDPHNSFTLTVFGVPLLVNNVYRDLYGSPFHKNWVWTTRAQNGVLVNGVGQKEHSADLGGRILKAEFQDGLDYVMGDATESYEGRLTRAQRHVVFVKPDLVVIADDLEAPKPSTFQFMLHGQREFQVEDQRLVLDRGAAGVVVDYVSGRPLKLRQWTGYSPEPDHKYLASIKSSEPPPQWHVEASTVEPELRTQTITVMRVFRGGAVPKSQVHSQPGSIQVDGASIANTPEAIVVRRNGREWRIRR
ncbi:MAG: DUF4962 domain-containing protein [Acidobacteriia bacterium]|nr:DUF4962 domain-containing protein [Terriglobia bacterium]